MAQMQAYPLTWPDGWKRTLAERRRNGHFNKKEIVTGRTWSAAKSLTVSDSVSRVVEQLGRMGVDRQDLIISTNVRTRLDGLLRSGESDPKDPGAAVYWRAKQDAPMRCMAIDGYTTVADNLAAIAATLEAMRAIERHGGAETLDRAFTGFAALPSSTDGPSWWVVMGIKETATVDEINNAYRQLARLTHPDSATGNETAMTMLNIARDQALAAAKGRG